VTAPRSSLHRRWLSFGLVGQITSVLVLVSTTVGLLRVFDPGLFPGGGSGGQQPGGKVVLADVNPRATLLEYQRAERNPIGSLSKAALQRVGVLTTIRYSSSGFRAKELQLAVTLTSRTTGDVVCGHTYPIEAGDGSQITFRVWSPFPAHPRPNDSYDLHVTLFPPSGHSPSLDAADRDGIPAPPATSATPLPIPLC
jgi:hypothetical protein